MHSTAQPQTPVLQQNVGRVADRKPGSGLGRQLHLHLQLIAGQHHDGLSGAHGIAGFGVEAGDATVERRPQCRVVELRPRLVQARLGLLQRSPSRIPAGAGLLEVVLGNQVALDQRCLSPGIGFELLEPGTGLAHVGQRAGQTRLQCRIVKRGQLFTLGDTRTELHVTLLQRSVVEEGHFGALPRAQRAGQPDALACTVDPRFGDAHRPGGSRIDGYGLFGRLASGQQQRHQRRAERRDHWSQSRQTGRPVNYWSAGKGMHHRGSGDVRCLRCAKGRA